MYQSTKEMEWLKNNWAQITPRFNKTHIKVAEICKKEYQKDGKAGIIELNLKYETSKHKGDPASNE
jgi:hypothetical protein